MSEFKDQAPEQEVYGWITVEPDGDGGEQRDFNKGSLRPDFGTIPLYIHPSAEINRLRAENARLLSAGQALEADFSSYRREVEHKAESFTQRADAAEQKLAEALALLRDAPGAIDRIAANICTELNALDQLKAELSSIAQPAEVKP